jgi:hypothetical protein
MRWLSIADPPPHTIPSRSPDKTSVKCGAPLESPDVAILTTFNDSLCCPYDPVSIAGALKGVVRVGNET